ncbi:MAG: T9SS type A sorting domain-containing protein [Bacteroidota bacterium]|nr:T9SS type A sorting domain-containing protein [Bacteroidota bacterium]MDP4232618.1 T9SS type A sorting domain-containing protein [Bacteroidota bacterium]
MTLNIKNHNGTEERTNTVSPDSTGFYDLRQIITDGCGSVMTYQWTGTNPPKLFISTDRGDSWMAADSSIPNYYGSFARDNQCHLILWNRYGIFESSNHGVHWDKRYEGAMDTEIQAAAFDSKQRLFALTANGNLFRSSDYGRSWQSVSSVNEGGQKYLWIDPKDDLYTLSDIGAGLLLSTDGGNTWSVDTLGIGNSSASGMAFSKDGYAYAVTRRGLGLMRSPLLGLSVKGNGEVPMNSTDVQSFPNPFTRSTTIHFALPKPEYVTIAVFDAEGREVARLASREFGVGAHDVTFDRSEGNTHGALPAGVYFYRITAGGEAQTQAMIAEP